MSLNYVIKSFKHYLNPTKTILTKLVLIELSYLDLALTKALIPPVATRPRPNPKPATSCDDPARARPEPTIRPD